MKKMEVLAPAGSFDIFKKVIAAGADAVYLGGDLFGARAYASNFNTEEVLRAIDYAHIRERRVYLTVNTLLKQQELDEMLFEYLRPLYEAGLDAVIVQDMGVLRQVRTWFPQMAIHASTQMSVTSRAGAAYLKDNGVSRIVPARELSAEEVAVIDRSVDIELECFVHGALCYCYSGQCLFSSLLGGRSGNRGRCAQPCRLAYQVKDEKGKILNPEDKYVLSLKDLCTINLLPKLAACGVDSLKIEGRMKQAEYAAGVTAIYRRYVDHLAEVGAEKYHVSKADEKRLFDLGNRSGFTDGYYHRHNGADMFAMKNPSHSGKKDAVILPEETKREIFGCLTVLPGQPIQLSLYDGDAAVSVQGDIPDTAQKRPVTEEELRKRISKTGDTPFVFGHLDVIADDGLFVPVQALNRLRRDGMDQMKNELLAPYRRTVQADPVKHHAGEEGAEKTESGLTDFPGRLTVSICQRSQLQPLLEHSCVTDIILDAELFQSCTSPGQYARELELYLQQIENHGKKGYLKLPVIFREKTRLFYDELIKEMRGEQPAGLAVSGIDGAAWAAGVLGEFASSGQEKTLLFEAGCYTWTGEALSEYADMIDEGKRKISDVRFCAPYELNKKELIERENRNSDFCVYGYLPMMISAQCLWNTTVGCRKNSGKEKKLYLEDRYFKNFLISANCADCYNVIYNSRPQMMFHQNHSIAKMGFGGLRMNFVRESVNEIEKCLNLYERAFLKGEFVGTEDYGQDFTNGHLKRGVE